MAAGARARHEARVLRVDRGARRLGSRAHAHARAATRRRLGDRRREACGSRTVRWRTSPSYGRRPTTASRHSSSRRGRAGSESRVIKNKLSLRASSTAELELADVRVPDSARLPDANGLKAALQLPRRSALRDRVGRLRRRARLHRYRVELHAVARAVRPPAEPHAADPDAARERRSQAHGSATNRVAAREAQRSRRCDQQRRYRWRSGTTCARRSISRVTAATCWARPA